MRNRTPLLVAAALLFLLLGVLLTYRLNSQITPVDRRAASPAYRGSQPANQETEPPTLDVEPVQHVWPPSGDLLTEDDIPALPPEHQDWLADPGWNQPYITPTAAPTGTSQEEEAMHQRDPYAVDVLVDAPLNEEGTMYRLAAHQDEAGAYAEVAMHARPMRASAGQPRFRACVWAFRDGTIQIVDEGGEGQLLTTTHRYELSEEFNRIFIVRLLVVDGDGGRRFADSLPIEILAP